MRSIKTTLAMGLLALLVFAIAGPAIADEATGDKNLVFNMAARYYPTCTVSNGEGFRHQNLWLEGNLFYDRYSEGHRLKGSIEWFGAGHTEHKNNPNTTLSHRVFTGRVGYDVGKSTYVTLSYKSNKNTFNVANVGAGSGTWSGVGIGIDKRWDAGRRWDINTNLHFYPRLSGPRNWDYRAMEYEIGATYKVPDTLNIDFGFRGEKGCGRNSARGSCYSINGPYAGISKKF